MGGTKFSQEKLNAREVLVSSDITRLQGLASRDLQNLLGDGSADDTTPVSSFSGPCALTGIAATYQMLLAAAQAFFYNPSDSSLTVDDSSYEVVRWPAQNLTFANPSGSPRIDLVVATPAMVDADSQSRNILVDPVARTITPQNVFKTTNPLATLAVVTGTPAGTPVPPAVPAGAVALFEVYLPTGAADSTTFGVAPRLFRRAAFPLSTMNGVISGRHLTWDLTADPTTTSSALSAPSTLGASPFVVLIDGEVITCNGSATAGIVSQDAGAQNPFNSAAPAGNDRPYYIYAVGGRHCPQGNFSGGKLNPLAFVESTIQPDRQGRPSSSITTPRGTTTLSDGRGGVLVGIGFVVKNTVFRRACIMTDDMVIGMLPLDSSIVTMAGAGFLALPPFASHPPFSSKILMQVIFVTAAGGALRTASIVPDDGAGAPPPGSTANTGFGTLPYTAPSSLGNVVLLMPIQSASAAAFWAASGITGDQFIVGALGYAHEVRRIAGTV